MPYLHQEDKRAAASYPPLLRRLKVRKQKYAYELPTLWRGLMPHVINYHAYHANVFSTNPLTKLRFKVSAGYALHVKYFFYPIKRSYSLHILHRVTKLKTKSI